MPELVWDKVGDRVYETGLDKGVLYLPDGSGVPWNGLTSIIEQFDKESSPVYYDGMKISDLVVLGDFEASMKAVTYPDEFIELEGLASPNRGTFFGDQPPQTFGLCYRTQVGNDLEGDIAGYKIHIIYNVTAIPSEKTYSSITADPSLVEFEWNITAVPEEVPGFRPTAHIIIDSRDVDPWLLEDLLAMLYGSDISSAVLIPMPELAAFIINWCRVKIIDNGDGTWTAVSSRDGFINVNVDVSQIQIINLGNGMWSASTDQDGLIVMLDSDTFEIRTSNANFLNPTTYRITDISVLDALFTIIKVNAVYLDDVTYEISSTCHVNDVPQIKIIDLDNGLWRAETDQDNLIVMIDADTFEIRNATVEFLNSTTYRISDTIDN